MRELTTTIEVDRDAGAVWQVLMDFGAYPGWNPFVVEIRGEAAEGARLSVRLQNPSGRVMTFTPVVTACEPGRRFSWLGKLGVKGLFDGHHAFEITPVSEGRVRLTQREAFSGLLVPLLWRTLSTETRAGFEAMNAALKERAEAAPS